MSHADRLLAFVDSLDAKSRRLLESTSRASAISNQAMGLHLTAFNHERRLASLNDAISHNLVYLLKINGFQERFCSFETSLDALDSITNENTLANLRQEWEFTSTQYRLALQSLDSQGLIHSHHQNGPILSSQDLHDFQNVNSVPDTPRTPFPVPVTPRLGMVSNSSNITTADPSSAYSTQTSIEGDPYVDSELIHDSPEMNNHPLFSRIPKSTSISDIRLKPIRCRSKKVYKKKSKYRLSSIYNINPMAESPILESNLAESGAGAFHGDIDDDDDNDDNEVYNGHEVYKNNEVYNSNKVYNSHEGYHDHHSPAITAHSSFCTQKTADADNTMDIEQLTICTTPDHTVYQRCRSNSVPGVNIFNSKGSMKPTNIMHHIDTVEFDRLRHFISIGNLNQEDCQKLKPGASLDDLAEEQSMEATIRLILNSQNSKLELDAFDMDNVSVCSDFSYFSPEQNDAKLGISDSDFVNYLRASRLDLNSVLPNPVTRSTSHESVFSKHEDSKFNFHNPIMSLSALTKIEPTINGDYIYSEKNPSSDSKGNLANSSLGGINSASILSRVIASSSSALEPSVTPATSETPLRGTPLSTPLAKLFNFSASDLIFNTHDLMASPSFSRGFLNMVKTPEKKTVRKPLKHEIKPQIHGSSTDPIFIDNPTASKRIPIPRRERTDGSHSKLTVGRTQTILSHGQSSYFKRPLVSKVSKNSLQEALSFNLYEN